MNEKIALNNKNLDDKVTKIKNDFKQLKEQDANNVQNLTNIEWNFYYNPI